MDINQPQYIIINEGYEQLCSKFKAFEFKEPYLVYSMNIKVGCIVI